MDRINMERGLYHIVCLEFFLAYPYIYTLGYEQTCEPKLAAFY